MTDVPVWIGAIGTVSALFTGLILFANQLADRRRQQAGLIALWLEWSEDRVTWSVQIQNGSGQPIYDCQLDSEVILVYPTRESRVPLQRSLGVVAPGERRTAWSGQPQPEAEAGREVDFVEMLRRSLRFHLSFADATGRRWVRDERGRLRRLRGRQARPEPYRLPSRGGNAAV